MYQPRHSKNRRPPLRVVKAADEALLGRVAGGDQAALAQLYDRHAEAVYGLARRMLTDPARAGLVTEEVFLTAWQAAGSFDPSLGSGRAWLLTGTRRRAVDVIRDARGMPDDPIQGEPAQWPHQLSTCPLATLTQHQQDTIDLAYFGGLTCSEIAEVLRVPLPAVGLEIRAGLRALARDADHPHAG